MTKKHYMLQANRRSHMPPLFYSAEPERALEEGYSLFLDDEDNISVQDCGDDFDEFVEGEGLPDVFEVTEVAKDEAVFRAAWAEHVRNQQAKKDQQKERQEAHDRAHLARLKAKYE